MTLLRITLHALRIVRRALSVECCLLFALCFASPTPWSIGASGLDFSPATLIPSSRFSGTDFSYQILSLKTGIFNNSFTLSQYNRYSGAYLDEEAKANIINSIPNKGFNLTANGRFSAIGFSYRNWGGSSQVIGSARAGLEKELFSLILYGNELNRQYEIESHLNRIEALCYLSNLVARGVRLNSKPMPQYWLGFGFRVNQGIYYFKTLSLYGYLLTDTIALNSQGYLTYLRSYGGIGIGADFGFGAEYKRVRLIFGLINLNNGIKWTDNSTKGSYFFSLDSVNLRGVKDRQFFFYNYAQEKSEPFKTILPIWLNFGIGYKINQNFNANFIYQQSLVHTVISKTIPEVTLSTEFRAPVLAGWLQGEVGVGFGGEGRYFFTYGLGFIYKKLSFTTQVKDISGIFLGAKGAVASLKIGYNLYLLGAEPKPRPFLLHTPPE